MSKEGALFGCTVCSCRVAGSLAGILEYLIKLNVIFNAVSIKGSVLMLYALAWPENSCFSLIQ